MSSTPRDRNETWPAEMVAGSVHPAPRSERYEIVRERARGGLGRVAEANDRALRRVVAVKELLHRDEAGEARFVREAFITAKLQHPSIVPVYDAASSPDGAPFYVMKLVSGRTLSELIEEKATLRERMALLPNVIAVTDAIAYAHSQGVLHRDVKGSNVIVGDFGETIVIDWGLAKRVEDAEEKAVPPTLAPVDGGLTVEGTILGTPDFMAPEQARGEVVDARTDVYALGALLYCVLTRKAPHEGVRMPKLIEAVRAGVVTPVREREPGVPPDLASIVERAMARDPGKRYPTARELGDDLRRFQNGGLVAAYRYTARDRMARALRRHLGVALATGVFLFVGAIAFAVFAIRAEALRRAAETERDRASAAQARADAQSLALFEQQGRDELEAGRPARAAVYLSAAYEREPQSLVVRSLLTEALRPLASHRVALVGHERDVPAGAYSPDGSLVATGADDRTVRVWDARTGRALWTQQGFTGPLEWVAFSHDGSKLVAASGGSHPHVSTWSLASHEQLQDFDVPENTFRTELTPDDASLVVGTFDGNLRIVDLATRAVRLEAKAYGDRVSAIAFRPGTTQMAIGSLDRSVMLWDWKTGKRGAAMAPFDGRISSARYSDDGRYLLVAEDENLIHVFDAGSLAFLRTLHLPESAEGPDAFFSNDARLVVVGTKDGMIRVYHTSSGALLRVIDTQPAGQLYRMALRSDGGEAVTMGGAGNVNLWSLDAAVDYRLLGRDAIDEQTVLGSTYFDGGRSILMPRIGGEVQIRDATTGEVARSFTANADADRIAIAAHDSRLATSGERAPAFPPRVWDLGTGGLVATLLPSPPPLTYGLAATTDGTGFLTGDYVGVLHEWDAVTGAERSERTITQARISAVAAHPDGRTIAVANEHGLVYFVDRQSGAVSRTLQAHGCWVQMLRFAADGRTLLTVGRQDHTVKVWREPFGEPPVALVGHTSNMERASLSDDGARVASVSGDGTARLWDARTGEQLRVIHGPTETAEFRPDSHELLTTGQRGYAVVWDVALDPRSPREVAAYVAGASPWRLVDGRLQLAK